MALFPVIPHFQMPYNQRLLCIITAKDFIRIHHNPCTFPTNVTLQIKHSMSMVVWISRVRCIFIIVFVIKTDKQHHRNTFIYCSFSVMLFNSSTVSIKHITLENKHLHQRKTVGTTRSQSNFSDLVSIDKGCLRIQEN